MRLIPALVLALACGNPSSDAEPTDTTDATDSTDAVDDAYTAVTTGGDWRVTWASSPDPIPFDEPFELLIDVETAAGQAILPAELTVSVGATMPAHGHGMTTDPVVEVESDHFRATGMLFHMTGRWELEIAVQDGDGTVGRVTFPVRCCDAE